jgi:1,4-dihydroxy-2-naphthoate octaprenyltransferase
VNQADAPAPAPTGLARWWAGARPRTLPAAIVPVLVGTAAAAGIPHAVDGPAAVPTDALRGIIAWRLAAALVVALAIQVGTNYANDYSDGVRGTDDAGTRVGPRRLVGSGLASPSSVKKAAFASFGVAAVAGLALAIAVTWWLIPLGLVCFAAGWFYTGGPRPYGYAGLGEVFVFVFFGIVATVGSAFVQTSTLLVPAPPPGGEWPRSVVSYPWLVFAVAAAVGCLATALLVINNLRDIPTDTKAGKRTLAVKLGDRRTRLFYVALMVVPYLIVPVACGLGGRPLGAASLFAVVLANRPVLAVVQGASGRALIPVLGQTGRVQLAFGALLAAGLFLSA